MCDVIKKKKADRTHYIQMAVYLNQDPIRNVS